MLFKFGAQIVDTGKSAGKTPRSVCLQAIGDEIGMSTPVIGLITALGLLRKRGELFLNNEDFLARTAAMFDAGLAR